MPPKYTPAKARSRLRWWVDEDGGHFAVSDTGMGIPPEHIPRLTERSIASTPDAHALPAARAWGWRSSKHVLRATERRLRCRAPSAAAAPSPAFPAEPSRRWRTPDYRNGLNSLRNCLIRRNT